MLICLEWFGCFIALIYGLSCFNIHNTYSYYDYYNESNNEMVGVVYIFGAFILGLIAYLHGKIEDCCTFDDEDTYFYGDNSYHEKKHHTSYQTINYKTSKDILKDISSNYPIVSTQINELTVHEIKKKGFFKKEKITVSTTIIPNNKTDETSKKILKEIIKVLNDYTCYENIGEIRKNILGITVDINNNIIIHYNESSDVSLKKELTKKNVKIALKEYLPKYNEIKVVMSKNIEND